MLRYILLLPVKGVIFVGRKGWRALVCIARFSGIGKSRAEKLAWRKLHDKNYQYPPGSFPLGNPVRQRLVALAEVPLQAFPLGHVTKAKRGQGYYIRSCGMYDSPFAPGTGLKWPCPDYTFKSKLSPDEYLNYVSPVSGVPMYMTQKEWEHQISLYVTTYLTAENLHIPQWLARPAGRYLKPPNTGKIMAIYYFGYFFKKS